MATQHTLTIKRFSAGLCALLFAYASMSSAFADKKGIPNDSSVADISEWIVVCGPLEFSVTSNTKELSNILLVFDDGEGTFDDGTWEKFEIEDGILVFIHSYDDARRVVTAFVKAGSEKSDKNPLYGNHKLGFEFNCPTDPTDAGA